MRVALFAAAAVGVLIAATVACGGSSKDNGTVVEVTAQDNRFHPDVIQVPAGQTVTIRLKNLDKAEHDLEVRGLMPASTAGGGHGGHGGTSASNQGVAVHTTAGKSASVTFKAEEKGTYEVFCTQPGHEQLGMVAKLVVV